MLIDLSSVLSVWFSVTVLPAHLKKQPKTFICIQIFYDIFFSVEHANCHHWQIDYTTIRWKQALNSIFLKHRCFVNGPNTFPFFCFRSCVIFSNQFCLIGFFKKNSPTLGSSCALELHSGFSFPPQGIIYETSMIFYKIQKKRCPKRIHYYFRL